MLKKKAKHFFTILVASTMLCSSLPISGLVLQIQASNAIPIVTADDTANLDYPDDLTLISYGDLDELRQWNDTLGYFDDGMKADMKTFIEENITQGVTDDYEKAHLIFDWIHKNINYAYDHVTIYLDPWDVFTYKSAVCGGFSNLYKAMLNSVDIPSVLISGNTVYGAHIWNAVYAGGKWFYSDSTWGGNYFDPGTEAFLSEHTSGVIQAFQVETEDGLLIGYDNGVAVIGVTNGITTVDIPDMYKDLYITSVPIGLFNAQYGIKTVNVGQYINNINSHMSSSTLEAINVVENNPYYASKDGVLFTNDMSSILIYPEHKTSTTFVLPKATTSFDIKETFANSYLQNLEVENGNTTYASHDGALYNAKKTELLMVPGGKTELNILSDASINEMAFANVNTNDFTIYAEENSPAYQFAAERNINFVSVTDCDCKETVTTITKATTTENGHILVKCKDCGKTIEKTTLYAVNNLELSKTDYTYDDEHKQPEVTVKNTNGTTLEAKHYTVSYPEESKNPGTYTVTVTLQGDYYTGTLSATYEIKGQENPFTDVTEKDYFYHPVLWAVENKITSGYSSTLFAPDMTCTRAEVVTFLWRANGCPEPKTSENPFEDVTGKDYYYKAILWASENNITKGISKTQFAPKATVTRGQFAAFLWRSEGRPAYTVENPFSDLEAISYYYDAILWAYGNGITAGYYSDLFAPDFGCTRCQVVSFLYRNK